jgi:hypothetical protein
MILYHTGDIVLPKVLTECRIHIGWLLVENSCFKVLRKHSPCESKKLVKKPKLYFWDGIEGVTGPNFLSCTNCMHISPDNTRHHPKTDPAPTAHALSL